MKPEEAYKKDIESVRLSEKEQGVLFAEFRQYMKENPVPMKAKAVSPFWNVFHSPFMKAGFAAAVFLVVVVGSVGAERALPGDALYPMKIHVNENALRVLSVTEEREAKTSIRLTQRRLREAVQLIEEQRFEEADANTLKEQIAESAKDIVDYVNLNQTEGDNTEAIEIASEFQTILKAHDQAIDAIEDEQQATSTAAAILQDGIYEHEKAIETELSESVADLQNNPGADEALPEQLQENLEQAKSALESAKTLAPEATTTLMMAEQAIRESEQDIQQGMQADAFVQLEQTEQALKETVIKKQIEGESSQEQE